MKHLFVLLIFISLKNGLQAQATDSTNTMMKADSAGSLNISDSARASNMNTKMDSTSTTMADSLKASIPNRMDSTHTASSNGMDSMTRSSNPDSMSHSSNSTVSSNNPVNTNKVGTLENPTNSQGMEGYAALPVAESYVPADVMDKIKSKYGSGTIIYDVTAVRAAAPMDSATHPKDSSLVQQPQPDSASAMAMTTAAVKYNYVVRIIKDGVLKTEYLADDGITAVTPWRDE